MVLQYCYCENCSEIYTNIFHNWCKPCQINKLEKNFANWTSGNKKIDEFIQETQTKNNLTSIMFEWIPYNQFNNIEEINDIIVEWIPYNQFNDIKKIGEDDSATLYSATWINGPYNYYYSKVLN